MYVIDLHVHVVKMDRLYTVLPSQLFVVETSILYTSINNYFGVLCVSIYLLLDAFTDDRYIK